MFRSTDGGATWSHASDNTHAWVILQYAAGTHTLYGYDNLNGTNTIDSSSDFGQTWTTLYNAPSGVTITSMSVSRDGTKLYDVEIDNNTFASSTNVSTDSGATWTPIHQGDTSAADYFVFANGENTLLIIGQLSIVDFTTLSYMVSSDSGSTWSPLTTPVSTSGIFNGSIYFSDPLTYNYPDGTTLYHVKTSTTAPTTSSANVGGQSLENNPTINSRPTFSGTTQPFAQVTVTVHSNPVTCSTTADASGLWSCQLPEALSPGTHTVVVGFVFTDTTTQQLGPYTVTVPAPATPASVVTTEPRASATSTETPAITSPVVADTSTPVKDANDTPTTSTEPVATSNPWSPWWLVVPAALLVGAIILIIRKRASASQ